MFLKLKQKKKKLERGENIWVSFCTGNTTLSTSGSGFARFFGTPRPLFYRDRQKQKKTWDFFFLQQLSISLSFFFLYKKERNQFFFSPSSSSRRSTCPEFEIGLLNLSWLFFLSKVSFLIPIEYTRRPRENHLVHVNELFVSKRMACDRCSRDLENRSSRTYDIRVDQ